MISSPGEAMAGYGLMDRFGLEIRERVKVSVIVADGETILSHPTTVRLVCRCFEGGTGDEGDLPGNGGGSRQPRGTSNAPRVSARGSRSPASRRRRGDRSAEPGADVPRASPPQPEAGRRCGKTGRTSADLSHGPDLRGTSPNLLVNRIVNRPGA